MTGLWVGQTPGAPEVAEEEPEAGGRWVPIAEAARALGITTDAIRKRVQTRALRGRRQEGKRFWLIWLPGETPAPQREPSPAHRRSGPPGRRRFLGGRRLARQLGFLEGQLEALRLQHAREVEALWAYVRQLAAVQPAATPPALRASARTNREARR